MDLNSNQRWKVGMTKQSDVYSRISSTANPDYFLVRGYAIPDGCDAREIEKYIHWRLEGRFGDRIIHTRTNQASEWFEGEFIHLIPTLEHYLRNILSGLLGTMGRENEYKLIVDIDEDGIPFENLIYDQNIWVMDKFQTPLSKYHNNPAIRNYLNHVNSNLIMPYYTMVDICSMNLNQCEEFSVNAFARERMKMWEVRQFKSYTENQLEEIFKIFLSEEKKNREHFLN